MSPATRLGGSKKKKKERATPHHKDPEIEEGKPITFTERRRVCFLTSREEKPLRKMIKGGGFSFYERGTRSRKNRLPKGRRKGGKPPVEGEKRRRRREIKKIEAASIGPGSLLLLLEKKARKYSTNPTKAGGKKRKKINNTNLLRGEKRGRKE